MNNEVNELLLELDKKSLELVLELRSSGTNIKIYSESLLNEIFDYITYLSNEFEPLDDIPKSFIQILFFLESQFRGNSRHCNNKEELQLVAHKFNDHFRKAISTNKDLLN